MFSSSSFAEWTKVTENIGGAVFYINFEEMRKHDGYTYVWRLTNYLKPNAVGNLSDSFYIQIDCKIFSFKNLSAIYYNQPMGKGTSDVIDLSQHPKYTQWNFPSPESSSYTVLKSVCNR